MFGLKKNNEKRKLINSKYTNSREESPPHPFCFGKSTLFGTFSFCDNSANIPVLTNLETWKKGKCLYNGLTLSTVLFNFHAHNKTHPKRPNHHVHLVMDRFSPVVNQYSLHICISSTLAKITIILEQGI